MSLANLPQAKPSCFSSRPCRAIAPREGVESRSPVRNVGAAHAPRRACVLLVAAFACLFVAAPTMSATDFVATKPTLRVEYWQTRLAEITAALQDRQNLRAVKLVFLGDSITDFWGMAANPWMTGQTGGRAIWEAAFAGQPPANRGLNLGISGDRTEHV